MWIGKTKCDGDAGERAFFFFALPFWRRARQWAFSLCFFAFSSFSPFHCAIMVNKIMKQLESQTSKIHNLLFKKKHSNNNAQVVLSRKRGTEGSSSTYSLLLCSLLFWCSNNVKYARALVQRGRSGKKGHAQWGRTNKTKKDKTNKNN